MLPHKPEKLIGIAMSGKLWGIWLVEKVHSQKLIRRKGISHASHRFNGQCAASSLSFQAIVHVYIPRSTKKGCACWQGHLLQPLPRG